MRVCIVTRQDLFPAVHGAAVKIVRTAEGISEHTGESLAVTTDREIYHRWIHGRHEVVRALNDGRKEVLLATKKAALNALER